jgi:uncharacterized membrane protein
VDAVRGVPAVHEEVTQIDDTHMHWVAQFGGSRHEWDAEITEQKPDERVAWRNTDGKENAGVVTFHRIDDDTTIGGLTLPLPPTGMLRSFLDTDAFLEESAAKGGQFQ